MTNHRKNYDSTPAEFSAKSSTDEKAPIIFLGHNPTSKKSVDFANWLDKGIDEWVWTCITQLRDLLSSKSVSVPTIGSYGINMRHFFKFLIENGLNQVPAYFDSRTLEQFIFWLKQQSHWTQLSQKNVYAAVKAVLIALQARHVIPGNRTMFPSNPFPGTNLTAQGATPLSPSERIRLAEALRKDIVAIYNGNFNGSPHEALTIHALTLALRTGLNPTPLMELRRDSLRAHPFMPSMMTLETFKRRGNATHVSSLRFSEMQDQLISIPMDGVALFRMVLKDTQAIADEAPERLRDRVWLYRKKTPKGKCIVKDLSHAVFSAQTKAIIQRHDLFADDGTLLRVNASRLRKTMENRLWELSNGDLFSVASIMGHSPKIADNHYLSCTNEMRQNATFVGEALPDIYRGNNYQIKSNLPIKLLVTPVGSCKDSLYGQCAPQDGKNHCSDFFSCFSCRSYAIVGAPKDLHRLFSFYWFLYEERKQSHSLTWIEKFTATIDLIDMFTLEKFDPEVVTAAKKKAKTDPIRFWDSYKSPQ